jgi:hypothetical protein
MSEEKPEAAASAPPPSDAPAKDTDGDGAPEAAASEAPADAAAPPAETESAAKKRKRKRKKVEAAPLRQSLSPEGRERPAFLLAFPEDPELEKVMRAFELGNYAFVRKAAPELAEKTTDAKVRAAAEELARRIEPDPLVKVLLGLALGLLVLLTFWAYKTHGG